MSDKKRTISVVLGKPGAGKSWRLKKTIIPAMPKPVFVVDMQSEFQQGVIYTGEGHELRHPVVQMLELMREGAVNEYGTQVIRPHPATDYNTAVRQLADFLRVADSAGWPGTYIIDEADLFGSAGSAIDPIKNMVFRGRHASQHMVFTAKKTTTISKNILAAAHCVVCFKQTMDEDLKRLNKSFSAENRPAKLGEFEYIVLGDAVQKVPFAESLKQNPKCVYVAD